jgi:protein O-mannosyl-transferase
LILLTLVVYGNTLGLGFALDAVSLVKGDPRVRAVTAENVGLILRNDYWWPSSVDMLYRPVTTASFLFNYAVLGNGERARGYHAVNVLLHGINALLVFHLAALIFREKRIAFFAAALWALHPVTTESVANIAGRADLLAAAFVLSGLLMYTRIAAGLVPGWKRALAVLFLTAALGAFSKESAAVLLGLMLLWDVAFGGRGKNSRRWAAYGAVALTLALLFVARHWVFSAAPIPEMPFADNPLRGAGFWPARFTALKMVGMDLLLLLWPAHLAAERGFDQIPVVGFGDGAAWFALVVIAAILAAVVARYRKDPAMFWAAGFFGIALLPVSNLIFLIGATMAERFLYLPSIGLAVAVAGLMGRIKIARSLMVWVSCAILLALAGRTMARNGAWNDDLTLAQTDVPSAPRSARLQELLASSLFERDPVGNLDGAISTSEKAWEILKPLPPGRIFQQTPARLGMYYRLKGDRLGPGNGRDWYERSLAVLERAREASQAIERGYDQAQLAHGRPLATRVVYQPLYADLGITLMRLGRYADAAEALRYGREVDPRTPEVYDLLAQAYAAQGERDRAVTTLLGKAMLLGTPPQGLGQITTRDICAAEEDLTQMLRHARLPDAARQFEERAGKQGCAN